jgi:hypothetical protein
VNEVDPESKEVHAQIVRSSCGSCAVGSLRIKAPNESAPYSTRIDKEKVSGQARTLPVWRLTESERMARQGKIPTKSNGIGW